MSKPAAPTTQAAPLNPLAPLAPLSPAQIKAQATATINSAYQPAYQDIGQQQARAQGISQKRSQDNRYYNAWLDAQMATLQSHQDASNAAFIGMQRDLMGQQQQLYQQPGQLTDAANQRPGNVSNNADSLPINQGLAQTQAANMGHLTAAEQQATSNMKVGSDLFGSARANNFSLVQASETKQLSDLDQVLGKLSDARTKLDTSKTGDLAKEIGRLQGIEIQKAQSNRDYAAAVQKLGLQAANLQSQIQTRAGQLGVAQQNANTGAINAKIRLSQAQTDAMYKDLNYKLSAARFDASTAKDLYERTHGLGPYRVSNGHGTKPVLSASSQNVIYNRIFSIQGQLNQLIAAGVDTKQAWHILHNGGAINLPTGKTVHGKPIYARKTYTPIGDDGLLNAAYNTIANGSGLTPGDMHYLTQVLGLSNPSSRLSVSHNQASNAGHGTVY